MVGSSFRREAAEETMKNLLKYVLPSSRYKSGTSAHKIRASSVSQLLGILHLTVWYIQ
jgi:hypothetical protein